jgi:hypothetical protein
VVYPACAAATLGRSLTSEVADLPNDAGRR